MRFSLLTLLWALPLVLAQSSTSNAPSSSSIPTTNNSTQRNQTLSTITTTITSLLPGPSNDQSNSRTSLLTLTLTLNTTASPSGNTSLVNGNGTLADNGTMANATEPWKEGDDWIPFNIRIDPAYGVLGALLILSGIPVAVLGGKNRWSSLAVVSGYALMLFTLVMILRFGVQDNLQPPSPNPPSTTLRGLYLLACIVAAFIGAGIGIFLFNIAKYFVAAAGGFAFGWFLLEVKSGGLITSVLGRWGLLGGLTVASTLASIVPKAGEFMVLFSTAWIGATAFILGVDCYTRAGLKEFYVYNLGFHSLFPKLEGAKYPLTQTMIIELGILAACVLIGGAIQAKVLSKLQRRLRVAREEEEMRIEAEEVSRAAERFKNVGSELAEWEEKHGSGKGVVNNADGSVTLHNASTSQLPILGREQAAPGPGETSPSLPPVGRDGMGLYEELPMASPPLRGDGYASGSGLASASWSRVGTPAMTGGFYGVEELKDDSTPERGGPAPVSPAMTDPELEGKLKLLEEVKRARESIRGSIDELRKQTPTPSLAGRLDSQPATPALSLSGRSDARPMSIASRLDGEMGRDRRISTASSHILDAAPSSARDRRQSTTSSRLLDIMQDQPATIGRYRQTSGGSSRLDGPPMMHSRHMSDASRLDPSPQPSPTEWEKYLSDRQIMPPPSTSRSQSQTMPRNPHGRDYRDSRYLQGQTDSLGMDRQGKTASMVDLTTPLATRGPSPMPYEDRRSRTVSMLDPGASAGAETYGHRPESGYAGHAGNAGARPRLDENKRQSQARSMTYDELSDRHRKRISALQEPVSAKMKEEQELQRAREKWERTKKAERAEMERRQREVAESKAGGARGPVQREEVLRSTDEWRRSVHGGLDGFGRPTAEGGERGGQGQGSASARARDKRMSGMIN